ncbi:OLC1v1006521C1 [Oldenlandia corymbosa var. corymbosa]|uniref:OLC1v1006521C1 n=1 Tax=Oldenlandia corymbosa var. corymbosa TaxID=529605 RepID=A0AAV1DH72_OLDCO|nr:OLC1v1006521C1 [Oldenlandia corymbosa var. corymbosa]
MGVIVGMEEMRKLDDDDEKVDTRKQDCAGKTGGRGKMRGTKKVSYNKAWTWLDQNSDDKSGLVKLSDTNMPINQENRRIPLPGLFGAEVERVVGAGGIVPGSLVLVGGDPGAGKSTFLLQVASIIADGENHKEGPAPVVYVSGEESIEQIRNRAYRMNILQTADLSLYSSTEVNDMLEKVQCLSPHASVIESIQTVYMRGVAGQSRGPAQVKECTAALQRFAKKTNIPILLAGQVTKEGILAGPRELEHAVDVVLYIEGDKLYSHRVLRSVKNRFGSTDEIGVFEMSQLGFNLF